MSPQSFPTRVFRCGIFAALLIRLMVGSAVVAADVGKPCHIRVVDAENGWPVPAVELKTIHGVSFWTDNSGVVAFDLPELMGRETWFAIASDGYEVPADGFGSRGVRLTPRSGGDLTVKINRTMIAKRLGRVTGAGIFAESQKLGDESDWKESGVLGCDSVQNAVYRDRMYWSWGDTNLANYPLGIFDSTSATTAVRPLKSFEPPLRLVLDYHREPRGRPRGVAKMPGDGPTWLTGYATLPDKTGRPRLVSSYMKPKEDLKPKLIGLCAWNDDAGKFEHLRDIWIASNNSPEAPPHPCGHSTIVDGKDGKKWILFGDPLPKLRCEATFEAWQNPDKWEVLTPQATFKSATDGAEVKPHAGSIAWNGYRKRWVAVFHQIWGKPSFLGELWYAEADEPTGLWGPAVKIVSHKNYTFYNARLHPEFTPADSPILLFEGTYTASFADNPPKTPRYDYNQILYRLDLDDPKLAPAQVAAR